MTDQQWINDLRNKEQEFKQAVPNDLWSNIERNLPVPNSSKHALILPMWLRYGGVAATVIAILTLGGLFLNFRLISLIVLVDWLLWRLSSLKAGKAGVGGCAWAVSHKVVPIVAVSV